MNLKSVLLSLLVVGVFALAAVTFIKNKPAKVVYVNMDELFNGFQMKKELENDFISRSNQIQKRIETLQIKITNFKEEVNQKISANYVDSLNRANTQLSELNRQFQEEYMPLKEQYDAQIQNQLLNYMKEFGKANDYDLVITNLNGSTVIFGSDDVNVTTEALEFVNQKYAGK
jgi:outer membrane protein